MIDLKELLDREIYGQIPGSEANAPDHAPELDTSTGVVEPNAEQLEQLGMADRAMYLDDQQTAPLEEYADSPPSPATPVDDAPRPEPREQNPIVKAYLAKMAMPAERLNDDPEYRKAVRESKMRAWFGAPEGRVSNLSNALNAAYGNTALVDKPRPVDVNAPVKAYMQRKAAEAADRKAGLGELAQLAQMEKNLAALDPDSLAYKRYLLQVAEAKRKAEQHKNNYDFKEKNLSSTERQRGIANSQRDRGLDLQAENLKETKLEHEESRKERKEAKEEKAVQALGKDLESAGDGVKALGAIATQMGKKDIPGIGRLDGFVWEDLISSDGKKMRQAAKQLVALYTHARSGAQASDAEREAHRKAYGLNEDGPEESFRIGIETMARDYVQLIKNKEAKYNEAVRAKYKERGGVTSEDIPVMPKPGGGKSSTAGGKTTKTSATPAVAKTVVDQFYSPSTKKTKYVYSDGTEEIK